MAAPPRHQVFEIIQSRGDVVVEVPDGGERRVLDALDARVEGVHIGCKMTGRHGSMQSHEAGPAVHMLWGRPTTMANPVLIFGPSIGGPSRSAAADLEKSLRYAIISSKENTGTNPATVGALRRSGRLPNEGQRTSELGGSARFARLAIPEILDPASREIALASRKIALFGNFGRQNIGNECTLQALAGHLRELLPQAEIYCICSEPDLVAREHSLSAVRIRTIHPSDYVTPPSRSGLARAARILLRSAPRELMELLKTLRQLRGTTDLLFVGTGMLEDDTATRSWVMSILRWALAARMRGCRVAFVSIGAGPIESTFARLFTRAALRISHYVSYRDETTRRYMHSIGCNTGRDRVYPDLAFSLSLPQIPPATSGEGGTRTVAIGVVDGSKFATPDAYLAYLRKLSAFMLWVLDRGFHIRAIHGDGLYDIQPINDLIGLLRASGLPESDPRLQVPALESTNDLLSVLADVELIVASRYHNIVLGLALGKPVIGLAYHWKFAAILSEFGLGEYCQNVWEFEPATLQRHFGELTREASSVARAIEAKARELRAKLDEQYQLLFQR